ncbi:uncharacterized protein [Physcomitrium patens]|uniref:Uncharacterized protein n=1 Tax=Physcomitrium patens TaxID=3218 RepID=A0A2K1KMW8_PHYPA|nr:hypothetical protein PHYPA_006019 [Physcomitrium patens]
MGSILSSSLAMRSHRELCSRIENAEVESFASSVSPFGSRSSTALLEREPRLKFIWDGVTSAAGVVTQEVFVGVR